MAAFRLDCLVIKQCVDESFKTRHSLTEILAVVDNNIRTGIFLVDASATTCKAFRADIWIIRVEDAPDLAATAYSASDEVVDAGMVGDEAKVEKDNDAREDSEDSNC